MSDPLDDLRRMQEQLASLPEPIAYIVLDHGWPPGLPHGEGRDANGKRYVLCSPSVLDAAKYQKYGEINIVSDPLGVAARLAAIPLYRREDMHEGWPDAPKPSRAP